MVWSRSRRGEGSSRGCKERPQGCKSVGEKVYPGEARRVDDLFGGAVKGLPRKIEIYKELSVLALSVWEP